MATQFSVLSKIDIFVQIGHRQWRPCYIFQLISLAAACGDSVFCPVIEYIHILLTTTSSERLLICQAAFGWSQRTQVYIRGANALVHCSLITYGKGGRISSEVQRPCAHSSDPRVSCVPSGPARIPATPAYLAAPAALRTFCVPTAISSFCPLFRPILPWTLLVEACCLTDDWLETQVAARVESFRRIDLALRSSVGKRLVGVIHEFTIDPDALRHTTLSRYGASGSRSLATVHDT